MDTESRTTTPGDGRSVWSWLLPALALVVGAGLGAGVVAAGGSDDDALPAQVTASPAEDAQEDDDVSDEDLLVRVPASCLAAAESAEEVARQLDDVADAVAALDAQRLQEVVDRFQQLQPEVEQQAAECRQTAGDQVADGELVTPSPSPTA